MTADGPKTNGYRGFSAHRRGEVAYRRSVRAFSVLFVVVGLAILVRTFAAGGGPLSLGTVLGVAFVVVGVLRLWLTGFFRDRARGREPA